MSYSNQIITSMKEKQAIAKFYKLDVNSFNSVAEAVALREKQLQLNFRK